jgi:hypothetical protein
MLDLAASLYNLYTMHLDTLFLTVVILVQTTVVSLVKIGIEEVVIKPLAIRHTKRLLEKLGVESPLLKECWDKLDESLAQGIENVVEFFGDRQEYIKTAVLSQLVQSTMSEQDQKRLSEYLATEWSEKVFVNKCK